MGLRWMRALVFEEAAPDVSRTQVAQVSVPAVDPGHVLIEVSHAGINFKDVMMRRGDPGYVVSWPVVPGLEVSGVIADLGPRVEGFRIGDRVAALTNAGGLAEFVAADAALTARVPDGVPLAPAAVAPGVYATAHLLVHELARARAGDTILVHSAAGAVGSAVAALARPLGELTLVGVVGSPSRIPRALAAGYDAAFVRGDDLVTAVRDHLHGPTVNIVLDPQGTAWVEADLEVLAPGGRIVLFGNAAGGEFAPMPSTGRLYAANASIGGFSLAALSQTVPTTVGRAIRQILDQMAAGTLHPEYVVSPGLASAAELQQRLSDGAGATKYVIEIDG